jgi:ATP-binding cassette subfamily B protein
VSEATPTVWDSWKERFRALRNVPTLGKIVWQSGRSVVSGVVVCRLVAALIPVAMLGVSKRILDAVQNHYAGHPLVAHFWWLVGAEFALAALGAIASRIIGFFELLLADRFTRRQLDGNGARFEARPLVL